MDIKYMCTKCGQEGVPIIRRGGRQREAGHLKCLWCLNCREERNHVEVKIGTHYDMDDFWLEYNNGNFDKDGNRIMKYGEFKVKLKKEGIL